MIGAVRARRIGELIERELVFLQPHLVGIAAIKRPLELLIGDDAALDGIHQQHLAGLQAALELHVLLLHRQHAGFRGHDDQVVVGHQVPGRAEAVAVEGGADRTPVGEGDGRGTVPRLHERGMVFVKGPLLGIHVRVAGPSLGNQHGHGVGDGAARHHQQFQRIIEVGGIAAARLNDGEQLLDVAAEQRRGQHGLARMHPVHVALQCIDFAVVRDVAVRVRQLPGGKRIGGKTLVHQAKRTHHIGIVQLGIEVGNLRRQQQAFIHDGAGRERWNVKEVLVLDIGRGYFGFNPLAHHIQLALELIFRHALAATDKNLLNVRLGSARHAADGGTLDGRIPPAQHGEAFFAHDTLDDAFAQQARVALDRKKRHADAIFAGRRQGEAELGAFAHKERVRDLNEHAGAIAGFRIAAAGAAMCKVDQNLDAFDDNVVGLVALDAGHKTDPTGIVFQARMVKALSFR